MTVADAVLRLTLVRHGRAQAADPALADFDRPLDRKGETEALEMARRCVDVGCIPDLIVSSPALRTSQTAATFARALQLSHDRLQLNATLYLADHTSLLGAIQQTPQHVSHLMLVSHNPGLSDLALQIAPDARLDAFETGGLCTMSLSVSVWSGVGAGSARDVRYDSPSRFFDFWS